MMNKGKEEREGMTTCALGRCGGKWDSRMGSKKER